MLGPRSRGRGLGCTFKAAQILVGCGVCVWNVSGCVCVWWDVCRAVCVWCGVAFEVCGVVCVCKGVVAPKGLREG